MLTEREAWLTLAQEFDDYKHLSGICLALREYYEDYCLIDFATYGAMKTRLMTRCPPGQNAGDNWWWPRSRDGARTRAQVCREFARECEETRDNNPATVVVSTPSFAQYGSDGLSNV